MSSNTDSNQKLGYISPRLVATLGALASIVTILGFFGISQFSSLSARGSTGQVSTPAQALNTFCTALANRDYNLANSQLTSRFLNQVESNPTNDPFIGCTFGTLTQSSTSNGVIYYYAPLTFQRASGAQNYDTVDLIQTGEGNWRIDNISCTASC